MPSEDTEREHVGHCAVYFSGALWK